jgi:predicted HD superfamily hydrolase involved in NAD metabolism
MILHVNLEKFVRSYASQDVYNHCVATAEMAVELARYHGLDEGKARTAGLLHDVARSLDESALIEQAERFGIELSRFERDNPVLLHARVGAKIAEERLGIHDPEIIEAIAVHTTGMRGMSDLARVLFVADYAEPTRNMPGVEMVRALLPEDLDAAVLLVLKNKIDYVRSLGMIADRHAIELYAELTRKRGGADTRR